MFGSLVPIKLTEDIFVICLVLFSGRLASAVHAVQSGRSLTMRKFGVGRHD